jgi:hypothetical protein
VVGKKGREEEAGVSIPIGLGREGSGWGWWVGGRRGGEVAAGRGGGGGGGGGGEEGREEEDCCAPARPTRKATRAASR